MTNSLLERGTEVDPKRPMSVLNRFGITTVAEDFDDFTVVNSMPVAGMTNPLTGLPTLAALTVLVDVTAGRVNYYRRGRQWTATSELNVELIPGALATILAAPAQPVVATAHPVGAEGTSLLAECTLTHRGTVIGVGTVHSLPLPDGPESPAPRGEDPLIHTADTDLAELMAVSPMPADHGSYRLSQRLDPMITNVTGVLHGGVSAAGLELVASAAVNHGQGDPMQTASIRINFLRPFFAGAQSSGDGMAFYEGTALRIGRTAAVADARAVGHDGKVAVIARVTAYR